MVVDAELSNTPRACRSCGSTVVDGSNLVVLSDDDFKIEQIKDVLFVHFQ
ncbi:hypothetical protein EfmAA96_12770 [Enterococcus faecium]|nr:hypothetical protein EfmAA96_12770 [Enterococcus faecium]